MDYGAKTRMQKQFEKYFKANPNVWRLFCGYTWEAYFAGRKKFSAQAIIERVRWHHDVEDRSVDEFKINNNFTAFYARKMMAMHPELEGFFRTRKSIADETLYDSSN